MLHLKQTAFHRISCGEHFFYLNAGEKYFNDGMEERTVWVAVLFLMGMNNVYTLMIFLLAIHAKMEKTTEKEAIVHLGSLSGK